MQWIAHKFGGSSVANAARYQAVARLLAGREDPAQIVVVSAMQGVTDALIGLTRKAAAGDVAWRLDLANLRQRHIDAATELLGPQVRNYVGFLDDSSAELEALLRGLELLGTAPVEAVELVSGLGEVWSARLLAAHFRALGEEAEFLDAREVLRVSHSELHVTVEWLPSQERLAHWRQKHPARRVIATGFVARRLDGRITTLGRNGSDYSASIFGALFDSAEIHIWTDVDGVLSADPRRVPEALVLDHLSYDEAFELAYFGAKVIHPQTMAPATAKGIPIFIRNTFNPQHPGTRIDARGSRQPPVKGITTINGMAMVTIEGAGMIGVPGTAERVFGALRGAGVSVTMISQGSSEHSICCVLRGEDAELAQRVLSDAFARELALGNVQRVLAEPGISVLAVVGDGMAGTPGVAARLFESLGRAQINVRAIAQGSSERNISVAISEAQATKALRAVHAGFYLSAQTISIALIGPGQVGQALLEQIAEARERLLRESGLDLRIRAIAGSRNMLLAESGVDLGRWRDDLAAQGQPTDLNALTRHIQADHLPHAIIIDCSAHSAVADCYADWLKRGIHVLTPNKQAGGGPLARYRAVTEAARHSGARWRYEATVGAGLPVVQTLRDLIDTGDRIERIEGIFSGTLAYLFNRYDGHAPFSELVRQAKQAGYTEPDPRDDLSGLDVARKLVILAREMGVEIELDQVAVESLVPAELQGVGVEAFLNGLNCLDEPMRQRYLAAKEGQQVLRYCAVLHADGRAEVSLNALPAFHPFAHIALTDNIVCFTTARYRNNPLIVRGPGAGPDVTAAGVFADLLRVGVALGARL